MCLTFMVLHLCIESIYVECQADLVYVCQCQVIDLVYVCECQDTDLVYVCQCQDTELYDKSLWYIIVKDFECDS